MENIIKSLEIAVKKLTKHNKLLQEQIYLYENAFSHHSAHHGAFRECLECQRIRRLKIEIEIKQKILFD